MSRPHEFPQPSLAAAFRLAARVAPRRTTVPVLGCARVATRADGGIDVSATDLTTMVEVHVPAARANGARGRAHDHGKPWVALLPAQCVSRVAAALDCATVCLGHEGDPKSGTVDVSAGEGLGTWSFNYGASAGSALGDFPAMTALKANRAVATVPDGRAFVDLLRAVAYAADEAAEQREYSGVLLNARRGVLCLTATNGHRLARAVGPWPGTDLTWHVPIAAIRLLLDVADAARDAEVLSSPREDVDDDDDSPARARDSALVRIFENPGARTAVFRVGPVSVAVKLAEELPKSWDRLVDDALKSQAACTWRGKASVLAHAVRGAAIVSTQPDITLQFVADGVCVRTTAEYSRAAVLAPGTATRAPGTHEVVNVAWRYLSEALAPFGDALIGLHVPADRGPIVVRLEARAMPVALVMPLAFEES